MQKVQALSTVLDKVAPLHEERKLKKEEVLTFLQKKPEGEQKMEHRGRVYKILTSSSKPGMSKKFITEMINKFNIESDEKIPDSFMEYVTKQQDERKKPPTVKLSITKA
jgi:hypothetical protein